MSAAKPAAYRLTEPVTPEHAIQKQITDALRIEIAVPGKVSEAGVVWWSVSHENYAGEVPGIRVSRGLIAGLPDIFVLWEGRLYFIELKTPLGQLSEPQKSVITALFAASAQGGIAVRLEDVLALLDGWGIPRKHRVRLRA
jgi:hypothetical protein